MIPIHRALLPLLAALAAACGDSGDEPPSGRRRPEQRLLLVGWDGATFDLVDPLIAAGRLPNLARLLERGVSARLDSTIIPISSAAWVSAVTGKSPGQTGVYSFFEPVDGSYDVQLITALSNRAAPIWRILTWRGLHVNVFGVPVTFPPEPVSGTMVAGMLSPFDADYAYPSSYTAELRARGFVPDVGIWRETTGPTLERIEEQLAIKRDAVVELLGRADWDFSMIVFKSLDVLSHQVYDGRTDTDVAGLLDGLDEVLGAMIAAAGPDTNVVVMSDHGFATYQFGFNLHHWLVEEGFAHYTEEARQDEAPSGPLAEARKLEHKQRLAELDLSRTQAYASTCEGNFGSVRLNVRGEKPEGCVDPAEREALLTRITERLKAFEGPNGQLVKRVLRGAELYPGEYGHVVPDLLFEVTEGVQVIAVKRRSVAIGYPRDFPEHALAGIFVAAGPGIEASTARGTLSIEDVAPTALHLLNQPVYREMTGKVHTELVRTKRSPLLLAEGDDPLYRAGEGGSTPLTEEQLREVSERLGELGYSD